MKSSIKIIKRKQDGDSNDVKTSETETSEKSVERSTHEMVTTVKSWIAELQQRKRTQVHSFSDLPVTATAPVSQNS